MALTKKQLNDVCLANKGHSQCRYLDEEFDDNGNIVHVCKKLSPYRSIIDSEIDEFEAESRKKGTDPKKMGYALGDNCQGYIVLKTKPQGYDVKP